MFSRLEKFINPNKDKEIDKQIEKEKEKKEAAAAEDEKPGESSGKPDIIVEENADQEA